MSFLFQVKFRCKICGYLYSRKDTLKDHIRGKHSARFSNADLNALVEVVPAAANVAKAAAAMAMAAAQASLESVAAAAASTTTITTSALPTKLPLPLPPPSLN